VMRLAASGGAPQVLATADAPTAIAVAGGYAVWAAADGVFGCTVASCAASVVAIVAPTLSGSIQGVAYDGQYVYFTDQGTGAMDGTAGRCPPLAGCPTPLSLGTDLYLPLGISFFDTLLLWTAAGDDNQNGAVYRSTKAGGAPLQVIALLDLPTAVVAAPLDLALGDGRIYWTDSGDGQVLSCPSTGCGTALPEQHATGRTGLRHIALGATCVFWTDDQGGGSVSKVAR
jgi:hypothetical protein